MSLRLEKGWGAWGLEFRPDFNAVESGMDAFINWKKDFAGKAATEAARAEGPARHLVTLTIETDMDVTLDEAIIKDGEAIGYISSGGYAHHVGRSMAMGYVAAEHAAAGSQVEVEILGEMRAAEVHGAPVYDADGGRMRG